MIVINPTDSALEIQFKGIVYSVAAKSELKNVPAEVAEHWQSHIHNFIKLDEDGKKAAPVVAPVEEKKDEVVAEVVATPKKK
jgi:hypothetical protein